MKSLLLRKQSLVPSVQVAPALPAHTLKPQASVSPFSAVCSRFGWRLRSAGTLLLLLGIVVGAQAQAPQLASWTTAVGGSSVYGPVSIALDTSGDLYVVNNIGNTVIPGLTGAVIKIPPSDPTCSTPGDCINIAPSYNSTYYYGDSDQNATNPIHVAVDSAGNVFIQIQYINSDGGNFFVRVPSTDLTCSTPGDCIETGLTNSCSEIAVDGSGNVYDCYVDPHFGTYAVIEYTLSGNTYTATSTSIPEAVAQELGGNPESPLFAADAGGNLYTAVDGVLTRYTALGGGAFTATTISSDFPGQLYAVAVDWNGNIYVNGDGGLWKFAPSSGGVYTQSYLGEGGSAFTEDASGDLYLGFGYGGDYLFETHTGPVNFGSVPVGATSAPIQLSFLWWPGTSGLAPVLTQGAAGQDFAPATNVGALSGYYGTYPSNTCGTEGYSPCFVYVQFTPTRPGERQGAAGLLMNGVAAETALMQGIGVGPQATFATIDLTTGAHLPSVQSSLGSGFNIPNSVAVDGSGNVFVTDQGFTAVKEIQAAGGYSTVNSLGSGLYDPGGVAVDGAGNVFVADSNNGEVKEILAAGGYATINTLGSGFSFPTGIALDGSGNVFVTDASDGAVKEILAAGGYATVNTLDSGFSFSYPSGMAVDTSGNVFVADPGHNAVKEILAAGGYTTVNTLGSGFSEPAGVAVDASGNVFVADDGNNAVKEILAAGGYTTVNTLGSGFKQPTGVALDGKGNVYVADWGNHRVEKLDYADPPSLSFATTPIGSTSSDSPQTVSVANDGNAPLILRLPTTGDNPSVSANFAWDSASTCTQTTSGSPEPFELAGGAGCTIAFDFKPTLVGAISGGAVLTDNNLNQTGAMQTIQLSGTSTGIKAILTSPSPGTTLPGASATFTWTAGGGVSKYEFRLGTTGPGSKDVYNAADVTTTSLSSPLITNIPAYGVTLYARIYSFINGVAQYNDYTYKESGSPVKSTLTSPTPGSTLGSSATFSWTVGGGVTEYEFRLGTSGAGSSDVYNASDKSTTALTTGAISIPAYGVTLYARLYSLISGAWQYNDYTYKESGSPALAVLTSPAPGSRLTGSSATFNWTAGGGVTKYEFRLGTTGAGSSDVYNAAQTTTTALTTGVVSNIPLKGATLYARLYSYINGAWQYNDYTYTETLPPAAAVLTSPTPGSTISGTSAAFNWTPGGSVSYYELRLGISGPGSNDVYNSTDATTTALTTGAIPIPTYGVTLYARLYSYINGAWQSNDYTYTESGTPVKAVLTSPTPGTTLTSSSATFSWTAGGGVSKYEFRLGTTGAGSNDVYNSANASTTALTTGSITVPTTGATLYARLYSYINGAWQYNDYTYTEK